MSDTVIRVENLSKKYVINHQSTGDYSTLRDKITDGAKSLGRLLIPGKKSDRPTREEFWALKDVSFEVKQGDRLGIIGRNGAGKSTLLKILSRITEPTSGQITIHGRVASLLEVGTGFHPELTGRENIFLNGAVLGMSRIEINKKFDEIVDFAEIEKFLDTPVKRYSSGMYVRLAFAVAAHLEPEILIVDEVLAVGDVQFQKKCLGKMQDISESGGRTVLFISHNIDALQRLCSHSLLLRQGKLVDYDTTTSLITRHLSSDVEKSTPNKWIDLSRTERTGTGEAKFVSIKYCSSEEAVKFHPSSNRSINFFLNIFSDKDRTVNSLAVTLYDQVGNKLVNADTVARGVTIRLQKNMNTVELKIERLYLNPGVYVVGLWLANIEFGNVFDHIQAAFEIAVINFEAEELGIKPNSDGVVFCPFKVFQHVND